MNTRTVIRQSCIALSVIFLLIFLIGPNNSLGQGPQRVTIESTPVQKLTLMVGESKIIKINEKQAPIGTVELVEPKIAEAIVLTPWQVYLSGKAPGITTLVLRGKDGIAFSTIDLEVSLDISRDILRLKEAIFTVLPEEKDIRIIAKHDSITLSGTVSSISNLSQVQTLADSYFPKKFVNLLEVAGVHQVMLDVRVAEISRSLLNRLGFNFAYFAQDGLKSVLGVSVLGRLAGSVTDTGALSDASDLVTGIFRFVNKDTTWTMFIDALKEQGLVKVLAEPTLITLSGKSANFLAGGEFPIPVPQSSGSGGGITVTIEYKPFGVGLNFAPTVLGNGKISMQVAPEVSELDFSRAITISGFVVPSLTTRRVSTVIELADGQSFAIAGLLKEDVREIISKFPILGEIPVLGALFRSSSFQKNETELIIIVTPHLVKPLDMAKQTLPTDQFIEPDDFEFYLLGNLEGKEKMRSPGGSSSKSLSKGHGLEGNFGHIVPK